MTPVLSCVEQYCVSEVQHAVSADRRRPMSYTAGIMLAFTSITSIGYGTVVPVTTPGRLFCIVYTMLGIPLALLAIADQGKFLASALTHAFQFCRWRLRRRNDKKSSVDRDDNDSVPGFLIVILFNAYILVGGLLFSALDANWSFLDAVYFTFISSSTVGFGDLTPNDDLFFPLTLIYISFGLTLSTILVDLLALNLRKLHYWGSRIKNCANTVIWFGGKRVTVGQLMQAICHYLKLPKEYHETLLERLDHIVNNTIDKMEYGTCEDDVDELLEGPINKCFDVDNDSITYIDASNILDL
ncbi:unnamed protein product [Soboliphyme baturini]|uniref:Ion channel n=1 Tax=Soboliphyme baturini TaxID=241478 RepID=A0A183IBQ2_9BILA|nr:unnamed protein product [Soboliphyme baturini]